MPIDVRWDDVIPDTILIVYTQPWNWQDYQEGMDRCTAMIQSLDRRADVIANVSKAGLVPKNALSYLRHGVTRNRPSNLDTIVIVGIPSLAALLLQTLRALYPGAMRNILEAGSLEAGRELLLKLRTEQALPSDKPSN